ncbi:hypothetical protein KJ909_02295 [Patescibacteria group bacterium]|nr:hypothetical protein [Patescibacteria group bacterium]
MRNLLAKIDIGEQFWLKKNTGIGNEPVYQSIGGFISAILPNIYVIAGIILFLLMVFGGFTYIKSAGSSDEEGVQKGQKAITAALVGFLIIFASYWIIQLIEIITGIQIFGSDL